MYTRLFVALACVLLFVRMPSLAQPMGSDQGLYAYVGDRILAGELPYLDAWDQKPPAIHYTYALLRALWRNQGVVAAADLAIAAAVAAMLVPLGAALASPLTGRLAALLFLLLSDPSFLRLGGVLVRAQCETFIAAAITGAFLLVSTTRPTPWRTLTAGLLLGVAVAFKYNAAVYGFALVVALWTRGALSLPVLAALAAGTLVVPAGILALFAGGGALSDLYYATITYNVQYSGETYRGAVAFLSYLLSFPVQHARVDALWLLGGAGCAVLLVAGWQRRDRWIAPAWVMAACLTIAINSSRGLPQYFVQALPALALAAAWAGWLLWTKRRAVNVVALLVIAVAVWRVNEFDRFVANIGHDVAYLSGRITRERHLARYGDRDQGKYSALAMWELANFIRDRTTADESIYVFGFASGAYVLAERASASRFFWSRPVIVDFNASMPGYGVAGLRTDLERTPPALVALQIRDWWPDVPHSADFFMSTPALADWLRAGYDPVSGPSGFQIWERRGTSGNDD